METFTEALETQHQKLIQYDRMLSTRQFSLQEVGKSSSDIFHYNDADFNFQFLNEKACDWFSLSMQQVINRGEDFIRDYYHPDTLKNELPKIKLLYETNDDELMYTNYHQIYNPALKSFSVCLAFVKICRCLSGFISILQPLENNYLISKKMNRIISQELFKINHAEYFQTLTRRELEILKLLAQGWNNPRVSDQLFISRRTVEQHRKNINRKLEICSLKDIMDYAFAFDLI